MNADKLAEILGRLPSQLVQWVQPLDEASIRFQLSTRARLAAFIAQTAHESGRYLKLQENLNYSAGGLLATFPSHFNEADAAAYARQPELIANRVYACRMGNGREETGDGWRFRGRGLIQITGRENYVVVGKELGVDLAAMPDLLLEPRWAVMAAGAFWKLKRLNEHADAGDFEEMTRLINGGLVGIEDRRALYERALAALG